MAASTTTSSASTALDIAKVHSNGEPFVCDDEVRERGYGIFPGEKGSHFGFMCMVSTAQGTPCLHRVSRKHDIIRHVNNVHRKLRPFPCPYCDHCCTSISSLKTHVRTHTGETPYVCDLCGFEFGDSSSLCRHRKTIHKQGPSTRVQHNKRPSPPERSTKKKATRLANQNAASALPDVASSANAPVHPALPAPGLPTPPRTPSSSSNTLASITDASSSSSYYEVAGVDNNENHAGPSNYRNYWDQSFDYYHTPVSPPVDDEVADNLAAVPSQSPEEMAAAILAFQPVNPLDSHAFDYLFGLMDQQ